VIQYRPFRNPDVPGLVEVWNDAWTGRGSVRLPCWTPLEEHVLAKLYFEPAGLIVAEEGGRLVGFAHGGFGPDATESRLSPEHGIVCAVAVRPPYRRRGIGSELLRQCLHYLRSHGAQTITAGSPTGNPFYMALYGGSLCNGFLSSDTAVQPFLSFHGFQLGSSSEVYHRRLAGSLGIVDGRFADLRRRYEFRFEGRKGIRSWWNELLLGPLELHDFLLEEKATGQRVARASVWEMGGFGQRWSESAAGLVEIEVRPDLRRRGLARFLLAQMFRYLQDQFFTVVEAQVPQEDGITRGLCRGLGFHAIDTSHVYRLSV
jgi:ribosomal protein S18 acetylase RimI-like enzyme